MLTTVRVALAMLAVSASPSVMADTIVQNDARSGDQQVESFLETLKAGKGSEAVQTLLSSSPLWSQRIGTGEQMVGQIDAAIKAYGPVISYEKISSTPLGTMAVREFYLVQHRDMVTRWEFHLLRTSKGWSIGYFGFTDQPTGWFS